MRKSLLKTIVATAVVGATLALSSVAAWAAADSSKTNTVVSAGSLKAKGSFTSIEDGLNKYYDYFTIPEGDGDTPIDSNNNATTGLTASVKLANSGTATYDSKSYYKMSSKAGNDCVKGLKANQTVIFEFYRNNETAATMSFAASVDGFTNAKPGDFPNVVSVDIPTTKQTYQIAVTVNADTDLYFYFDQQLSARYIAINDVAGSAKAYGSTDLYALDPVNNDTYIIHKVSSAEAEKDSLTESVTGTTTTRAYKKVVFSDGTYLEASAFDGVSALYAFKATDKAATPTATLSWS